MNTVTQLHAFYMERKADLQQLIESGRDVPADELMRQSRLIGWARRDWQNARDKARGHATA